MVRTKHRFILFGGLSAFAALALGCYWVSRPIAFGEARWKDPSWGWDRWRMVEDLRAKLELAKPSFDETTRMLGGDRELKGSRAEDGNGRRILLYELGRPFPMIGRGNRRTLLIGFDENGRLRGSEVREEDDF